MKENSIAIVLGGGKRAADPSSFEEAAEDFAEATGLKIKDKPLFLSSLRNLVLEAQRDEE